jgi:hypothetical protein
MFHDILGTAARLLLFAARTDDCIVLCDLACAISTQLCARDTSASTKVITDIFSNPSNAALIVKLLYRLPVEHFVHSTNHNHDRNKQVDPTGNKKKICIRPVFSVLRLVALLIKQPEDAAVFNSLCDMALFPCLLFVLHHVFPVGGRQRYTPHDPILSEQCVGIILAVIHYLTEQRTVYVLCFLELTDVLATLLMFAHRLQTVLPSDESRWRNWERLLLTILTNLTVSGSFYYSVGTTTRRLLCSAKTKKVEVAIGQIGGAICDQYAALKMAMERVWPRRSVFRNTPWLLCGSETVGYFLIWDFLGLSFLFQCAKAKERKVIKACKLCGGCMQEYYCSRECQKSDWMARHKEQCKSVCIFRE